MNEFESNVKSILQTHRRLGLIKSNAQDNNQVLKE